MTFRTESRIAIAATVPEVWAYMCDVGRWHEWAPTVIECRVRGGGPLEPGARLDQRAKGILGTSRTRSQEVTTVDEPRHVAFAGPLGTSRARWGMELEPLGDDRTDALMWIEVDLAGRRYVEDRATTSVVAGSRSREVSFTEHWTFALDGPPAQPWRLTAAGAPLAQA